MACLLWEDSFYESGEEIGKRISDLVRQCNQNEIAALAIQCREEMKLRHVPLLLVREMARVGGMPAKGVSQSLVRDTLARIIQRPDELTEFLAIYWKEKKQPLSGQVKKGLALAFQKFNEYSLAKYNRDNAIKLRDVLFLCHAKPKDEEQEALWKRLVEGTLATPDTWEVELSAGKDKKATWERLMSEKKLGGLALLRNLRNMQEVNVSNNLITESLAEMKTDRILPYRFIAAARFAPSMEPQLERAMFRSIEQVEKLKGRSIILIDVSGSMDTQMSAKSDLTRIDAACGLGILAREICEQCHVMTFSEKLVECPPRRGFALRDAIKNSQPHSGTKLGEALIVINAAWERGQWDRIIVITDEQSESSVPAPKGKGYMINVAAYKNGVGYGQWTKITGWSESIIRYIQEVENAKAS